MWNKRFHHTPWTLKIILWEAQKLQPGRSECLYHVHEQENPLKQSHALNIGQIFILERRPTAYPMGKYFEGNWLLNIYSAIVFGFCDIQHQRKHVEWVSVLKMASPNMTFLCIAMQYKQTLHALVLWKLPVLSRSCLTWYPKYMPYLSAVI